MLEQSNDALHGAVGLLRPNKTDLFGETVVDATLAALRKSFIFPPFSVLNAREGEWQERKKLWLSLGIRSEIGRGENLLQMSDTVLEPDPEKRAAMQAARNKAMIPGGGGTGKNSVYLFKTEKGYEPIYKDTQAIGDREWVKRKQAEGDLSGGLCGDSENGDESLAAASGTSIFDPVLCELAYSWWSFPGAQVVDPFAGGSVRGIVAAITGREYWGCDLSQSQIDANVEQVVGMADRLPTFPNWVCGDSREQLAEAPDADFIFSCPPYYDLEVYSDSPQDISNMGWQEFVVAYRDIVQKACARLRTNRFATFVVGDIRDDSGHYRNLVGLTVDAFRASGLQLYNDCVLVTAVGSLPVRINAQFGKYRKLGKTHQNVLCFVKGDWRIAGRRCQDTGAV